MRRDHAGCTAPADSPHQIPDDLVNSRLPLLLPAPVLSILLTLSSAADAAPQAFPHSEIGLEHTQESLSGGRAQWTETAARVAHRGSVRDRVELHLRRAGRFGTGEGEVREGGSLGLGVPWTAAAGGTLGIDPSFLPPVSARGHLHRSFAGGWGARLGLERRWYRGAEVTMVQTSAGRDVELRAGESLWRHTRAVVRKGSGLEHELRGALQDILKRTRARPDGSDG